MTFAKRGRLSVAIPLTLRNLAIGGSWPGPPDSATKFPARLEVDWVRVWSQGVSAR
jgi:beta-glucanase (GH16 family)